MLVAPGTYLENLDFLGKRITVRSDADGDPATHDPAPDTTGGQKFVYDFGYFGNRGYGLIFSQDQLQIAVRMGPG